jgi:hypothetical protein
MLKGFSFSSFPPKRYPALFEISMVAIREPPT